MSITYSLDAAATPQPAAAAPPPAPTGPAPAIVANRHRLDDRFPVLGFNIRTQGRPYFEVLLATDRTLFDPANASRRTPANFYAGRQDGGLARAGAEDTAYIVPAGVLRRFADAKPRPAEIFFTVAAYDAPDGPPILALPPNSLSSSAPSVLLGRDFHAQTMAVVLGVPTEKLRPVGQLDVPAFPESDPQLDDYSIPAGEAEAWSPAEDDAEAAAAPHDPRAMALDAEVDDATYAAAYAGEPEAGHGAPVDDVDGDQMAYEDGYDDAYGALEEDVPTVGDGGLRRTGGRGPAVRVGLRGRLRRGSRLGRGGGERVPAGRRRAGDAVRRGRLRRAGRRAVRGRGRGAGGGAVRG